jgi:hypothetical protein
VRIWSAAGSAPVSGSHAKSHPNSTFEAPCFSKGAAAARHREPFYPAHP